MTFEVVRAELDLWAAMGRRATLWWRDDDASAATPALRRLLALAESQRVPVAVAAIPATMDPRAAQAIGACGMCTVVQHGIAHANHAPASEKRSELGAHRAVSIVAGQLERGRDALSAAFGAQFLPVLVPPWNRIAQAVVQALPPLGYRGLSTFGPRAAFAPVDRLVECNTHVDPIAWRVDRSFVGAARATADLAAHLAARRERRVDAAEPTGLLTHHLDFDDAAWRFVDELFTMTREHRAAQWLAPAAVFSPGDQGL